MNCDICGRSVGYTIDAPGWRNTRFYCDACRIESGYVCCAGCGKFDSDAKEMVSVMEWRVRAMEVISEAILDLSKQDEVWLTSVNRASYGVYAIHYMKQERHWRRDVLYNGTWKDTKVVQEKD